MPVSVVVGGQFGSEGKGKIVLELAREMKAAAVVRVGGSNSGHTAYDQNGRKHIFRTLPTAALLPNTLCVIPAGAYIDVDVLLNEIVTICLPDNRLVIDPNATIITSGCKVTEQRAGLKERIGSTLSGTGAAVLSRIYRDGSAALAASEPRLARYVTSTRPLLRHLLARKERVVIEGTQGFGLSLLHSDCYPKVTSRDTTAAAFVSESGLSPFDVDDIVLVIRSFPIRVPGDSGPLPNEITWEIVTKESNATNPIEEYTSVTRQRRRVARFDASIVRAAIQANTPSRIVLNHVDYIDDDVVRRRTLSTKCLHFIAATERDIGQRIDYIGTGPANLVHHNKLVSALISA